MKKSIFLTSGLLEWHLGLLQPMHQEAGKRNKIDEFPCHTKSVNVESMRRIEMRRKAIPGAYSMTIMKVLSSTKYSRYLMMLGWSNILDKLISFITPRRWSVVKSSMVICLMMISFRSLTRWYKYTDLLMITTTTIRKLNWG